MKDIMDTLNKLEEYFMKVVNQEYSRSVVPSRTEEMKNAAKGLKATCVAKYKYWLMDGGSSMSVHDKHTMHTNPTTYKHS